MERPKSPYSIHSRPTSKKNKRIYYAVFRDETGHYKSAVSTGCTRRDDALRWCEDRLRKNRGKEVSTTLAEYTPGFWQPDRPFAQDRAAHSAPVSRGYLDIAAGYTRNHLLPRWGSWRLCDFDAKVIDDWVVEMYKEGKLAPATVNKLLQTLRTILTRAVVDGWISENPAAYVKPVHCPRPERSILTTEEAIRLLASPAIWGDFRHYAMLSCDMRY